MGPIIVPIKKLDSSRANFFVLLVLLEMSAIYANAAGLVAEPINPFISLPRINKGKRNTKSNKFLSTRKSGVIKAIIEIE